VYASGKPVDSKGLPKTMFVARRQKILTNALALRVTEEESQRISRSAAQAGLTVSEWGWQVVLECAPSKNSPLQGWHKRMSSSTSYAMLIIAYEGLRSKHWRNTPYASLREEESATGVKIP
jgi:hypothetical protein